MQEQKLYAVVKRFLEDQFNCVATKLTVGPHYGIIDVVGLRYSSNRYGGIAELMAVEVKPSGANFLKSLGQALGYSLMADRTYLALFAPSGITEQQKEMATQLNVGLIRIRDRTCHLELSSPLHRPWRPYKLALMRKLDYVECVLCRRPVARDDVKADYWISVNEQNQHRYICPECKGQIS